MHGSSGSRGLFVHLLAGAALGAVVVLMVWIFSGGRPFGEVVGTSDVSAPTSTQAKQTDVEKRLVAPAGAGAQLESEPPELGGEASKGGGDALRFRKPEAARKAARTRRGAAAKREARSRARTRKRQAVRVVSPPDQNAVDELPVAAVPSPEATTAPPAAPAPQSGGGKPAKPRSPSYVAGAGEG
jgi:hypothetical protein